MNNLIAITFSMLFWNEEVLHCLSAWLKLNKIFALAWRCFRIRMPNRILFTNLTWTFCFISVILQSTLTVHARKRGPVGCQTPEECCPGIMLNGNGHVIDLSADGHTCCLCNGGSYMSDICEKHKPDSRECTPCEFDENDPEKQFYTPPQSHNLTQCIQARISCPEGKRRRNGNTTADAWCEDQSTTLTPKNFTPLPLLSPTTADVHTNSSVFKGSTSDGGAIVGGIIGGICALVVVILVIRCIIIRHCKKDYNQPGGRENHGGEGGVRIPMLSIGNDSERNGDVPHHGERPSQPPSTRDGTQGTRTTPQGSVSSSNNTEQEENIDRENPPQSPPTGDDVREGNRSATDLVVQLPQEEQADTTSSTENTPPQTRNSNTVVDGDGLPFMDDAASDSAKNESDPLASDSQRMAESLDHQQLPTQPGEGDAAPCTSGQQTVSADVHAPKKTQYCLADLSDPQCYNDIMKAINDKLNRGDCGTAMNTEQMNYLLRSYDIPRLDRFVADGRRHQMKTEDFVPEGFKELLILGHEKYNPEILVKKLRSDDYNVFVEMVRNVCEEKRYILKLEDENGN